ncbi:MAG: hypothetical protein VX644_11400 [Planctomycetota bacterium]|nr:hypothetical protein [Planctomycetota bacterium]
MVDRPEDQEAASDDQDQDFTAGLEPIEDQESVDDAADAGGADAETADKDAADKDAGEADAADKDAADKDAGEADAAEETPEEEDDEPKGDDHPDAIAALKDLGARLDLNKHERVWRIFFYEQHGDDVLDQIHGLPSLKELWLLHTRVTKEGAEKARERLEGVTVHHG